MYYIKYMPFRSAVNASRNLRELYAASEFGFESGIFSCDEPFTDIGSELHIMRKYDGSVRPSSNLPKIKKVPQIIKNYIRVFIETWKLPQGVWSCHDLGSLKIAWLASCFKWKKPILVYDSHEFELGRNMHRSERQKRSVQRWERYLIKKCIFSIMVNDSIADEVQRIHGLDERPIVVRSTPDFWRIDEKVCLKTRERLMKAF